MGTRELNTCLKPRIPARLFQENSRARKIQSLAWDPWIPPKSYWVVFLHALLFSYVFCVAELPAGCSMVGEWYLNCFGGFEKGSVARKDAFTGGSYGYSLMAA